MLTVRLFLNKTKYFLMQTASAGHTVILSASHIALSPLLCPQLLSLRTLSPPPILKQGPTPISTETSWWALSCPWKAMTPLSITVGIPYGHSSAEIHPWPCIGYLGLRNNTLGLVQQNFTLPYFWRERFLVRPLSPWAAILQSVLH